MDFSARAHRRLIVREMLFSSSLVLLFVFVCECAFGWHGRGFCYQVARIEQEERQLKYYRGPNNYSHLPHTSL